MTPEALHHLVPVRATSGAACISTPAPVTRLSIRPRHACPGPTETGDMRAVAEACFCSLGSLVGAYA